MADVLGGVLVSVLNQGNARQQAVFRQARMGGFNGGGLNVEGKHAAGFAHALRQQQGVVPVARRAVHHAVAFADVRTQQAVGEGDDICQHVQPALCCFKRYVSVINAS